MMNAKVFSINSRISTRATKFIKDHSKMALVLLRGLIADTDTSPYMLISSSKDQPKIAERDLILANALAYVESLEEKLAKRSNERIAAHQKALVEAERDHSSSNA
jgi:hypothetical protein